MSIAISGAVIVAGDGSRIQQLHSLVSFLNSPLKLTIPLHSTPVANSTSTFGAPNPRIGSDNWPLDDVLAIDYQAFVDVADPNLLVAAATNSIMAPTPLIVAAHLPVVRSGGPGGSDLAGALSPRTTSVAGQKRARGKDEEEEVEGLTGKCVGLP